MITKVTNEQTSSNVINEAIEVLREHWVYDTVQLFNDCAVALERITQLLTLLEKRPDWLDARESEITKELAEFAAFIKESLAQKRLTSALVCPDEVEFRLETLLKAANIPAREKKKMSRRWSAQDTHLEPPIVEIARRYWDL